MYAYRFFNTLSTRVSEIYNEDGGVLGTIAKTYDKPLHRLFDLFLKGRYFVNYTVKDSKGQVVLKSKKDLALLKKRQYHIHYFKDNHSAYIHLVDKKSFDIGERTSFEYAGATYELKTSIGDWDTIKKDGSVVAEWKSSLKVPFKAYFRLVDEKSIGDELLFLGLFHTYLHAP